MYQQAHEQEMLPKDSSPRRNRTYEVPEGRGRVPQFETNILKNISGVVTSNNGEDSSAYAQYSICVCTCFIFIVMIVMLVFLILLFKRVGTEVEAIGSLNTAITALILAAAED